MFSLLEVLPLTTLSQQDLLAALLVLRRGPAGASHADPPVLRRRAPRRPGAERLPLRSQGAGDEAREILADKRIQAAVLDAPARRVPEGPAEDRRRRRRRRRAADSAAPAYRCRTDLRHGGRPAHALQPRPENAGRRARGARGGRHRRPCLPADAAAEAAPDVEAGGPGRVQAVGRRSDDKAAVATAQTGAGTPAQAAGGARKGGGEG